MRGEGEYFTPPTSSQMVGWGGIVTRKCNDRRGSSGERDSWKGGGEGMEGEDGVKMLK